MLKTAFYKNVTAALFGLLIVPGMIGCAETDAQDDALSSSAALTQEQEALIASQCEPILDDLAMVGQDQVAAQAVYDAYDACVFQITGPGEPAEPSCDDILDALNDPNVPIEDLEDIITSHQLCVEAEANGSGGMGQGGDPGSTDGCEAILDLLQDPSIPAEEVELILQDYDVCVGAEHGGYDPNDPDQLTAAIEMCDSLLVGVEALPQEEAQTVYETHAACIEQVTGAGSGSGDPTDPALDAEAACGPILDLVNEAQSMEEAQLFIEDYELCVASFDQDGMGQGGGMDPSGGMGGMGQGGEIQEDPCAPILAGFVEGMTEEEELAIYEAYDACYIAHNPDMEGDGMTEEGDHCDPILDQLEHAQSEEEVEAILESFDACVLNS